VFFDDLVSDPKEVVNGLFDWLELDPEQGARTGLETANKTEQYRNRTVQRTAVAVNRRGERFFRRYPRLKRGMRSLYYGLNRPASGQAMSPASRQRLDRFFQPYNSRLATQLARLGLDLPEGWA
jgi:hypothetical protein